MKEVPVTTSFTIRFLWAITWRNFLYAIVPIVVTGVTVSMLFVAMGQSALANPMARLATLLVSIAIAVPVTKSVIGKRLGKYRLAVVLADEADSA